MLIIFFDMSISKGGTNDQRFFESKNKKFLWINHRSLFRFLNTKMCKAITPKINSFDRNKGVYNGRYQKCATKGIIN